MKLKSQLSFALSAVVALTLFLGVCLVYPQSSAAAGETAVVAVDVLNVRDGPGTGYGAVTQVGLYERLPVLEKSGGWYRVQLANGSAGWVAGWLVSIETAAAPPPPPVNPGGTRADGQIAVVKGSYVNVRGGPGTTYDVISQVGSGERLPVLESSAGWYRVQLATGATGWIAGWLVVIEYSAAPVVPPSIPPAAPPPVANPGGGSAGGKLAVVTGSVVNVRSGPGTANGVTGQVLQGDKLSVAEQSGDWLRVQLPGGGTGWVAGWLVSVSELPPAPAKPEPPEPPKPPETPKPPGQVNQPPAGQGGSGGVSRGGDRTPDNRPGKALSLEVKEINGKTSAVIKADVPFDYTSFPLSGPDRLVVDLEGVAIGNLADKTSVNSKTVSQVRAGYYQKNPDITRLVFELKGGAQYTASLSGDRKVLTVQTYIPDISGSYKGKVITVDAGHGGPDPGAMGANGTKEKDVTLDIARRTAKLLEARGAKVVMARSGDYEVGLYERTDKANYAGADIFVSIHINAHPDRNFGGTTTYIYSGNGDPSQTARIRESDRLARHVQKELLKALGLRDVGVRSANFAVLRTSNMPAILVEVAFVSNAAEEKMMSTDDFRNKAAEAVVKGIGLYFSERRTAVNGSNI